MLTLLIDTGLDVPLIERDDLPVNRGAMGNGHNEVFGVQSPMGLHLGPVSCVGKVGSCSVA